MTPQTLTPTQAQTKVRRPLDHPQLIDLLQKAYSAEKAAAFAYQGHAASVKDHEVYFLSKIKTNKLLPFFEKLFKWGNPGSFNDIDLDKKYPVEESGGYCKK